MKKVLTLVLVLCLALTAAACGGGGEESGGAAKDTLTWVQAADVTSLDPHVGLSLIHI